jgi:hypothetical protein
LIVLYAIAPNAPLLLSSPANGSRLLPVLLPKIQKVQAAVPRGFAALMRVILNDISYADHTRMPR